MVARPARGCVGGAGRGCGRGRMAGARVGGPRGGPAWAAAERAGAAAERAGAARRQRGAVGTARARAPRLAWRLRRPATLRAKERAGASGWGAHGPLSGPIDRRSPGAGSWDGRSPRWATNRPSTTARSAAQRRPNRYRRAAPGPPGLTERLFEDKVVLVTGPSRRSPVERPQTRRSRNLRPGPSLKPVLRPWMTPLEHNTTVVIRAGLSRRRHDQQKVTSTEPCCPVPPRRPSLDDPPPCAGFAAALRPPRPPRIARTAAPTAARASSSRARPTASPSAPSAGSRPACTEPAAARRCAHSPRGLELAAIRP